MEIMRQRLMEGRRADVCYPLSFQTPLKMRPTRLIMLFSEELGLLLWRGGDQFLSSLLKLGMRILSEKWTQAESFQFHAGPIHSRSGD